MATDDTDANGENTTAVDAIPHDLDGVPTSGESTVGRLRDHARNGTLQLTGAAIAALVAVAARGRNRTVAKAAGVLGVAFAATGFRRRRIDDQTSDEESDHSDMDSQAPDVSFTDEPQEPRSKPDLDDASSDPRHDDGIADPDRDDNDGVTIDISAPSMADEPGEATGPDPEQAQPTRTASPEPKTDADADETDQGSGVGDGSDAGIDESVPTDGEGDDKDGTDDVGADEQAGESSDDSNANLEDDEH